MATIILRESQLNEDFLNEVADGNKTVVQYQGNTPAELAQNSKIAYNNAVKNGAKPNTIKMQGRSEFNNAADGNETVIGVEGTGNQAADVEKAAIQAKENGLGNNVVIQSNPEDMFSEQHVFTKKQILEARAYFNKMKGRH